MNTLTRLHRREDGVGAVETAVLAMVFITLIVTGIGLYRIARSISTVDAAAYEAARSASIARTSGQAQTAANDAASTMLTAHGLRCSAHSVAVDTSGFSTPAGQTATVRATVTCTVPLSDLVIPGLPGSRTQTGTAISVLDTYRQR